VSEIEEEFGHIVAIDIPFHFTSLVLIIKKMLTIDDKDCAHVGLGLAQQPLLVERNFPIVANITTYYLYYTCCIDLSKHQMLDNLKHKGTIQSTHFRGIKPPIIRIRKSVIIGNTARMSCSSSRNDCNTQVCYVKWFQATLILPKIYVPFQETIRKNSIAKHGF